MSGSEPSKPPEDLPPSNNPLFNHTTDCIVEGVVENGNPIVHRVNDAFENVFGYSESELQGENLNKYIAPEGRQSDLEAVDKAVRNGDLGPREVTRKTVDGPKEFLLRATGGEGKFSYAIYTDISEQKKRESDLQRERDRLEEFANVVAHDIRNPLSVAKGHLGLVRQECNNEHLEIVEDSLTRINNIIDDVLTLARQGEHVSEPNPVDLQSITEDCWSMVETEDATLPVLGNRIEVRNFVAVSAMSIETELDRLKQHEFPFTYQKIDGGLISDN